MEIHIYTFWHWYNWIIIESGVSHQQPNPILFCIAGVHVFQSQILSICIFCYLLFSWFDGFLIQLWYYLCLSCWYAVWTMWTTAVVFSSHVNCWSRFPHAMVNNDVNRLLQWKTRITVSLLLLDRYVQYHINSRDSQLTNWLHRQL
jgi:hypothetical protein